MPTICTVITAQDKKKIKRLVASGYYSTQSEVIRAGLRKLRTPK